MIDIAERVRALSPPADDADWADVLGRVARPRPRMRVFALAAGLAAVAVVLGATVLSDRGGRADLTDRALAAVSGGPVLHVVLSFDTHDRWQGNPPSSFTLVDLSTGAERPVRSTMEIWSDPARGLTHLVENVEGLPVWDSLDTAHNPLSPQLDPAFAAFPGGYRNALAHGQAVSAGRDVVEGQQVEWLWFPGPRKPLGQYRSGGEIGLDPATGEALFYRSWCPKCPEPARAGQLYRVETLEGVSREAASFTPRVRHAPRAPYNGHRIVPLRDANQLLGRQALWLGRSFAGAPFGLVQYEWSSRDPSTANSADRSKALYFLYGIRLKPDAQRKSLADLDLVRDFDWIPGAPRLSVTVTPDASFGEGSFNGVRGARTVAGGPIPDYDEVALSHPGYWWHAQFRKDGLYVDVFSSEKALALAGARALQPVP